MKKAFFIFLSLVVAGALFRFCENNWLQVTHYLVTSPQAPQSFNGFKILQLSDLHSHEFGKDNSWLIKKINKLDPDIIVFTGDMINAQHDNGQVFLKLAQKLAQDYPLYYVEGNHEQSAALKAQAVPSNWYADYLESLGSLGVIVLNNQKVSIKRGDQYIDCYGLKVPLMYYKSKDTPTFKGELPFNAGTIKEKLGPADSQVFNLLLSHTPSFFAEYSQWGANLVLSGHMHGGIIRIPFRGGLLSPEREFFPFFDAGEYLSGNTHMVINRGLGNYSINLRVFNRPEIVMVTLKSQE